LTLRRSFREWHYALKWIAAAICKQWQSQTLRRMRIHLSWFAKRRENPMTPIWQLTDLDRYIGRSMAAAECLFAHRLRAGQQPY